MNKAGKCDCCCEATAPQASVAARSGPTRGKYLVAGAILLAAWWLLVPAITSFMALNYTGTSTYTSHSGVKRELRIAIPAQAIGVVVGLLLFLIAQFKP